VARWNVTKQSGTVTLTYERDGTVEDCGAGPAVLEPDLVAWVADIATPWDIIVVEGRGTFARVNAQRAEA
jgi:hypothetical protein